MADTASPLLDFIAGRNSVKAQMLGLPAPDDADLARLLRAAVSAPDHGAIRPWRFISIRGDARNRLSDLFETALKIREPDADAEAIDNIRSKPLRSPLIVAIAAEVTENHPKVPPVEQIIATACATENLLLACEAAGYGAILLTGWPAHDATILHGLGFQEKDTLIGFLYIGTPIEPTRQKPRPDPARFLRAWDGTEAE